MYLELPIIGSGAGMLARGGDPYRVALAVPKSCAIPTKDGKPTQTTALVWVADKFDAEIDRALPRIPIPAARALLQQLDPKLNPDRLEQKPPGRQRLPAALLPGIVAARTPISRRAALIASGLGLGAMLLPSLAQALTYTSLASDTFNRANGALGANWDDGYSGLTGFTIVGNAAWSAPAGSQAAESYNAITWPNDQYSEGTIGSWLTENQAAVMVRTANPSTHTFYVAAANLFGGAGSPNTELYEVTAASYTLLADDTTGFAIGNTIRLAVHGTDLYVAKNGTDLYSAADSALASGRGGIYGIYFSGGTGGQFSFDSWAGGEVTDPAAAPSLFLRNLLGVGQ